VFECAPVFQFLDFNFFFPEVAEFQCLTSGFLRGLPWRLGEADCSVWFGVSVYSLLMCNFVKSPTKDRMLRG
jgi:hypothetical protein